MEPPSGQFAHRMVDFDRVIVKATELARGNTCVKIDLMCDTFHVLSHAAYVKIKAERAYYGEQAVLLDSVVQKLQGSVALRDQLIARQDEFISLQENKLAEYDTLLVRSNDLVEDATKNTDRALAQLNLAKWGTVGIVVGVVVGALLLK